MTSQSSSRPAVAPTAEPAKAYDPGAVEPLWLERWENSGCFKSKPQAGKRPYFIACPPPNVTGNLHIGHAVNGTIQDALCRAKRMQGYAVLWQPGSDHAGIGTQTVVERQLHQQTGHTRHDIGREAFLERVWAWKEESGNAIVGQYRRLGASLDFDRWRFTMDEGYSKAVRAAFVRLFDRGLLFRGNRIINWCPRCLTSLSDLEVDHVPETGALCHVRYPGVDGSEGLVIATVRPETILADVAVAVHPEDSRYQHLIGTRLQLPLVGRSIPVIADEYVEREFGTGALKITPGHDPNDFEIGLRHGLEALTILTPDGKMNAQAGPSWEGLDRFVARKQAVRELESVGLLVKQDPYSHQVGHCDRCRTVIEPRISEQWWLKMDQLAAPAIAAVEAGKIKFHADRWKDVYLEWLRNIRDWCVSRQLWWGHRIPVWTCLDGHMHASVQDLTDCPTCGKPTAQDPDVLDTWFSSALWPFATLGWPDPTPELEFYYPSHVLSTARDIMHLWVARMVFMSLEFLEEVPFHHVLIHATILGRDGARMSKSKGTGVDPLEIMDQYGTDACRFWMASAGTSGQDVIFMPEKIEAARNFANKIWNAARFALMNLPPGSVGPNSSLDSSPFQVASASANQSRQPGAVVAGPRPERWVDSLQLADRWIASRLALLIETVTQSLDDFTLTRATDALYEFIWTEFCDWWLELAKPRLKQADPVARQVLVFVIETMIKLLHPFMPFLTEEIYASFAAKGLVKDLQTLQLGDWPQTRSQPGQGEAGLGRDLGAEAAMELVMNIVRDVRRLRQDLGVPPAKVADRLILQAAPGDASVLKQSSAAIALLARVETVEVKDQDTAVDRQGSAVSVVGQTTVVLPLSGLLDLARERERLHRDLAAIDAEKARLDRQLGNAAFTAKAPAAVVDKLRSRLIEIVQQQATLRERLGSLH